MLVAQSNSHSPSRIVVIGASAGGPEALSTILSRLRSPFPAAVMVVVHLSPESPGYLPGILQKTTKLPVFSAGNQTFEAGCIYVAPPDLHLVVERGRIATIHSPRENRFRPSVDVTFRSAAFAYRQGVIGVILTGLLDDGTAGLFYVKRHGGVTIVQDPEDARFSSMPQNALAHVNVEYVAPAAEIGPLLNRLVHEPTEIKYGLPVDMPNRGAKSIFARRDGAGSAENAILDEDEQCASPSSYTCPDCGGSLYHIKHGELRRFRCRSGHAYALKSLAQSKQSRAEEILASAEAAMMEEVELLKLASEEAQAAGRDEQAARIREEIEQAESRAIQLGRMLN